MGIFNLNTLPDSSDETDASTVDSTAPEMVPPRVEPPRPVLPGEPPAPPPTTTHEPIVTDPLKTLELKPKLIEALSTVYDPEIPVNIYEMGLIYDIDVDAEGLVGVRMTLTSPGCPAAQSLHRSARRRAAGSSA